MPPPDAPERGGSSISRGANPPPPLDESQKADAKKRGITPTSTQQHFSEPKPKQHAQTPTPPERKGLGVAQAEGTPGAFGKTTNKPPAPEVSKRSPPPSASRKPPDTQGRGVAIVEDQPVSRGNFLSHLPLLGVETRGVERGPPAIRVFKKQTVVDKRAKSPEEEPIPDHLLTRRPNNPFGFGFSIDLKTLLAKLPQPKSTRKSRAVFLGPDKVRNQSKSPNKGKKARAKSRAAALGSDDAAPAVPAPIRKVKTRDLDIQAPETALRTRDSDIQAPDAGMVVARNTREAAVQAGASASESDSETMLARQKLVTAGEDVIVWRMRAETAEGRLAEALAKLAAEERRRKEAKAEAEDERGEKERARRDLGASQSALEASEATCVRLDEARRTLTATVEAHTAVICDLRDQLEAMRADRDAHKTAAEEARAQNVILHMRLGAATERKDSTLTEAEELRATLAALELERAAEEVRVRARMEEARDRAAMERTDLQRLLDDANDGTAGREMAMQARTAELERQLAAARAEAQAAEAARGAAKVEDKETVRCLIIKETELREISVRETLRETHTVEVTRVIESHRVELERSGMAHMAALAAVQHSRDAVEAELEVEQGRRRTDAETAAEAAAAAERCAAELAVEIARLSALLGVERETCDAERAQYERTAESAAAALAALRQELAVLAATLDSERGAHREERNRAEEQYLALQRTSRGECAALEQALQEERAAREAENAAASEEVKRFAVLADELRAETRRLEELVASEKAEREATAGAAKSRSVSHTATLATIIEEKTRVETLLVETRETHGLEQMQWSAQLAEVARARGVEVTIR